MARKLRPIAAAAVLANSLTSAAYAEPVKNIVLVHGAFADGSGWRGVYDELTSRGYTVSIVQSPLTSFADDIAATRRVLAGHDRPVIFVGHSYRDSVISEAGVDANVHGLVHVAAFAPDIGTSTQDQYTEVPPPPHFVPEVQADGFAYLNADKFQAGFAGDATDADAAFLRDSQVPVAVAALDAKVTVAARQTKPSGFIVVTADGSIDSALLRRTAARIGAATTDIEGSHIVFLTQPVAVADVIDQAAHNAIP